MRYPYETSLGLAIDQLINRFISAMTWAGTLVPFVAALFVRGPDFNSRFEARIARLGVDALADNTNFARLMEYQRLLAPVAVAKWLILHANGGQPLITNDLGYAPFANFETHERGVAIPITREHILALIPMTKRKLAIAGSGHWLPTLEYRELPQNIHVSLNDVVASISQRFIFGPDELTIKRHLTLREAPQVLEPGQLGFIDGQLAMRQELTWHRLVTALSNPPETDDAFICADFLKQRE